MNEHKISDKLSKWQLDKSKLSAQDLEVLKIVLFPEAVGYYNAVQKRITRQSIAGGFTDKQIFDINDIRYVLVPKNVALWDVQRTTPTGANAAELKRNTAFLENVLKAKAQKFVYIDADNIQAELNDLLQKYSAPKPTPSMKTAKPKAKTKTRKKAKAKAKPKAKSGLTEKQKQTAINKLSSGEMDLKECAEFMGVNETVLKPLLKNLNNV